MASGSGVIVSPTGYIVTNNHVVQDAHKITITLDGNKYDGELIGTDPSTDLAVIKIGKSDLPFLEFADFQGSFFMQFPKVYFVFPRFYLNDLVVAECKLIVLGGPCHLH